MYNDLKPCPFCNSKARLIKGIGTKPYTIQCTGCLFETDVSNETKYLKEDWNRRPHVDNLKALLSECYKRFRQYDMDNDAEPDMVPYVHIEFMKKLKAAIDS